MLIYKYLSSVVVAAASHINYHYLQCLQNIYATAMDLYFSDPAVLVYKNQQNSNQQKTQILRC